MLRNAYNCWNDKKLEGLKKMSLLYRVRYRYFDLSPICPESSQTPSDWGYRTVLAGRTYRESQEWGCDTRLWSTGALTRTGSWVLLPFLFLSFFLSLYLCAGFGRSLNCTLEVRPLLQINKTTSTVHKLFIYSEAKHYDFLCKHGVIWPFNIIKF
jgi:hypothetical protein